ncbi:ATP-dependent DNA helicase RecG [Antricoccus suffuscus]|uniref:ATP-dependent DNA helicase RecG n=1 Tax=Antricoccus suffuscus TaxID=1629062 RepID=A0A2T1A4G5_9ACTN|nr:ATP-dependent DNA helicase RecG [Antricoccus suffuscus]PRZ43496.1 ATP-dependent DNA helicase RecG [Antricoccus suffuscus]
MITLDTSLLDVLGLKPAKAFEAKFGFVTVNDLLHHYPRRYYKRGDPRDSGGLEVGEHVTFYTEVVAVQWIGPRGAQARGGKGPKGRAIISLDVPTGTIDAIFWNQPWRVKQLEPGTTGLFAGVVTSFNGKLQLSSPEIEIFSSVGLANTEGVSVTDPQRWQDRMMPIYPAKPKFTSGAIRQSVELVVDGLAPIEDPIANAELKELGYVDLDTALRHKHLPITEKQWLAADERLKFQEALSIQLLLAKRRIEAASAPAIPRPRSANGAGAAFDKELPFERTAGQIEVGEEIADDLSQSHPMHRLLQGDVGSGKTLVALRAMLQVIDRGGQAALLAPTEVLAFQHARSIRESLGPLGSAGELDSVPDAVKIVTLTAGLSTARRKEAMAQIASGEADIVVGTHALLEPKVQFADLGMVVIDEQHRFGVEQRDALRRKGSDGSIPHTLVMTATPIPRTVAITMFGELGVSTMRDMPPGRSPIATTLVPAGARPAWVQRAWERVREEVANGHQAYVVCPRIGLDDADDVDDKDALEEDPAADDKKRRPIAALELAKLLSEGELEGLRVEVLHGKLAPDVKDRVMRRFADGEIDVLVATTVIEVGVDVPNATVMVIMDAERFGLSTLHQLRGRVGRGKDAGLCLLITQVSPHSPSVERLKALEKSNDGFELARLDLKQRREGDVLGVAQSGTRNHLKLLSLVDDEDVIEKARDYCDRVLHADPTLARHVVLRSELEALEAEARSEYLEMG